MIDWLFSVSWSPYVAGIGIGLLAGLTLLISNKTLSCSTTFAKSAGLIERSFRSNKAVVTERDFFHKHKPEIDWQWMLVFGAVIGGFLSATLSGSFQFRMVYDWWAGNVSPGIALRWIIALVGGIFMGFGARWADGCTSGHGISGLIQLSLASIVAAVCFFAGGIVTAHLLVAVFSGGAV